MALTLDKIIYNVRNLIRDNRSDDIKISDRQLEFIVLYYRARLIKNDEDKKRTLSSNVIQDLGNVPLTRIDTAEDTVIKSNQFVLRTTTKIPKLIELNNKDAIMYVGSIDKSSAIDFVSKARSKWNKYNKYGKTLPTAYYRNGYVYIVDCPKLLKYINIEGIFEDPRTVPGFDITTDDYPISAYMISTINDFVLSKELAVFLQSIPDEVNDASSEIKNSNLYK